MSVFIHYSGNLSDKNQQVLLLQDMIKICTRLNWQIVNIEPHVDDQSPPPVKGVFFLPHKNCEAVAFLFNNFGDLIHLAALAAYDPTIKAQKQVSVKTQFSSPDIHIAILKLLRYVKTKYMPNLIVEDDGEYWERADRNLLEHLFSVSDERFTKSESVLDGSSGEWRPSESGNLLLTRIDNLLNALLQGDVDLESLDNIKPEEDISNWDISLN